MAASCSRAGVNSRLDDQSHPGRPRRLGQQELIHRTRRQDEWDSRRQGADGGAVAGRADHQPDAVDQEAVRKVTGHPHAVREWAGHLRAIGDHDVQAAAAQPFDRTADQVRVV